MKINRVFARASHETFTIKPIKELIDRYVGDGQGWVDPFAGKNSPAEITNDINPKMPTNFHLDASEFCKAIRKIKPLSYRWLSGVLFDPPYSYRQVSEHYKAVGIRPSWKDTSYNFYRRVMNPLSEMIKPGGFAISCGWNSNGFGKKYGFEIVEILLVAHGLHHNDTIVTVEKQEGRK